MCTEQKAALLWLVSHGHGELRSVLHLPYCSVCLFVVMSEWQSPQRKWPNFVRCDWSERTGSSDRMTWLSRRVTTSSRFDFEFSQQNVIHSVKEGSVLISQFISILFSVKMIQNNIFSVFLSPPTQSANCDSFDLCHITRDPFINTLSRWHHILDN